MRLSWKPSIVVGLIGGAATLGLLRLASCWGAGPLHSSEPSGGTLRLPALTASTSSSAPPPARAALHVATSPPPGASAAPVVADPELEILRVVRRAFNLDPASQPASAPPPATHWADDADRRRDERRLAAAEGVLRQDEMNLDALRDAAAAAARLERWDAATVWLTRLASVEATPELNSQLASALLRQNRWVEAIPPLTQVVESWPERREAWFNLAVAQHAARRINDARGTWSHVIEIWPENLDARLHRGEVLLDLHEWNLAAEDFALVVDRSPEEVDAVLNLALAHFQAGRAAAARDVLLVALANTPRSIPLMNRLAELSWTLYRRDPENRDADRLEALRWCDASLAIDPQQPLIQALRQRAVAASASSSE